MRRHMLLMVLALGATAARADNDNALFYLGAGGTKSWLTQPIAGYEETDFARGRTSQNFTNNSWKAFAGVRPLKWLAAEVEYIDLGRAGPGYGLGNEAVTTTHNHSSTWAAYAVGFLPLPLPLVDVYGKIGLARWRINSSISNSYFYPPPAPSTNSIVSTGVDFAWGVGVQAHISIVGVRLEYEGFTVYGNVATVASLSAFLNL
jgi:opacity protein-like surface antigen